MGAPPPSERPVLPDGLAVFVKRDCPTCVVVAPVLEQLKDANARLTIYTQDDPDFPEGLGALDDTSLHASWHHDIEAVPTLLKVEAGREVERAVGWQRQEWEALTGVTGLGPTLPDWRPGCGSRSVDPDLEAELAARFGGSALHSRRVELGSAEDPFEAMWNRGWSDGLPLVPPTPARVTSRLADRRPLTSSISSSRPIKLVSWTGKLCGCASKELRAGKSVCRSGCIS